MLVSQRLGAAIALMTKAAQANSIGQVGEVDKALFGRPASQGGGAPTLLKGDAHYFAAVPTLLGVKSFADMMGVGEIPEKGETPVGVSVSTNFRAKGIDGGSAHPHISPELLAIGLDFKRKLHNAQIVHQIMVHKKRMPLRIDETPYFKQVVEPRLKAFSIADWSNWLPTLNTSFFFEELEIIPGLLRFFAEFPMASRTQAVPGALTRLMGKRQIDTDTFTAQYQTQSNYTMTAQDCVVHTDITEDLLQDAIPNEGQFERLRRECAMGIDRSSERAVIEGDDTQATSAQGDGHMDSDVAGGDLTDFRTAFKGLRKRAIAAGNTFDNGNQKVNIGTWGGLIDAMGKWGLDVADIKILLSPKVNTHVRLGGVPEILTFEKAGPQYATLFQGQFPPVFGHEHYTSEWVREDLNASGVYAASSSCTHMIAVRASRFLVGVRAPLRMWAAPSLPSSDKMLMTAKKRLTFAGVPQSATEKTVACAYGIATV